MQTAEYSKHFDKDWGSDFQKNVAEMALLYGVQKKIDVVAPPQQVEPMPFTLFPSAFPQSVLREALKLQTMYQTLMYRVANDHEFMTECLKDILRVDDFTNRLWGIYETVRNEGLAQDASIMLTRNDYMVTGGNEGENEYKLKQVEFNTFSSGAGGAIGGMHMTHRYSLSRAGVPYTEDQLPENVPVAGLAKGLVQAHQLFKDPAAVILFVVGITEPNTPDQRWLEREIFKLDPKIQVVRRTFDQLHVQASMDNSKTLLVDGQTVSVVYYRHGYALKHYPTEKEYSLRLLMERSNAVKCPSVALHLAGCKKVQQALSAPEGLERFISDVDVIKTIRDTHVGQFMLDKTANGDKYMAQALETPGRYVLKPQREGGGNNLFDDDLKTYLLSHQESRDLSEWVLMEKIQACPHRNVLVRRGLEPVTRSVNSELGVFGVHIGTPSEELANFESGYLLRTKPTTANEAGLFSGQSCLDSPFLV